MYAEGREWRLEIERVSGTKPRTMFYGPHEGGGGGLWAIPVKVRTWEVPVSDGG